MTHKPVLMQELIQFLALKPNQNLIDATIGLAGHAKKILPLISSKGKILGIDQDEAVIDFLKKERIKRLYLKQGNFKNLSEIAESVGFNRINGIYFDLGLGSWQIEKTQYGLSFQKDMPLLMKIQNPKSKIQNDITASDIVNKYSKKELAEILGKYGEVYKPYQIANKIIQFRDKKPISSTLELAESTGIKNPKNLAKVFQALRIYVNNEFENLQIALTKSVDILEKGGRIVVISYHSGEDRIVKNIFRQFSKEGRLKIVTKKPVMSGYKEIERNKRARSAKMRVAEKII